MTPEERAMGILPAGPIKITTSDDGFHTQSYTIRPPDPDPLKSMRERVVEAIKDAVAEEREACAKEAEDHATFGDITRLQTKQMIATAIRARA